MLQIELDEDSREVELGKGAFGVVVKGRYRLSPVAVKRLINQTPEQQAQFLKEMAILRACSELALHRPLCGSFPAARECRLPAVYRRSNMHAQARMLSCSACPGSVH